MWFGPGLRGNVLGNLAKLNQDGRHIEEYNDVFQSMLMRTTSVRHDQEVDLYIAGIDKWLRIDVENQHPLNLDVAMNMARSYYRRQSCAPRSFSDQQTASQNNSMYFPFAGNSARLETPSSSYTTTRPGRQALAPFGASSVGSHSIVQPRPSVPPSRLSGGSRATAGTFGVSFPPERRLSRSEYNHRRSKGLCFHCDERWSPAHQCKQLFLLVVDEAATAPDEPDIQDSAELDNPGIFLHTITGTNSGNTMRSNYESAALR